MKRDHAVMAILSGAVLAAEIALTRVFAYLIWYHAVFLILSMALLGFAASGSLLTLGGSFFSRRPREAVRAGCLGFALLLLGGVYLPAYLPLESDISMGSVSYLRNLAVYFAYWGAAFMCAGAAVALILQEGRERVSTLYFASMAGSGLGCLAALGLLYLGPVVTLGAAALAALAAALLVPPRPAPFFRAACLVAAAGALAVAAGVIVPEWKVADSKQEFHRFAAGRIEETRWSPISVVQTFAGPGPGWRYWDTGIALHCRKEFPEQKGIIIDAYAQSAFTDWRGRDPAALAFFADCSTSAAYYLRERPRSLVIGIGGGIDILRALHFGAESVTGVELNGVLIDLLRGPYRDYSGELAFDPRVNLVKDEGRSFVKHCGRRFDVIQINYTDTWSASASGALALAENFLYTAEGIEDYWRHLSPDGILSLTRTLAKPYRETLRLVLTAIKALRDIGIAEPRRHLIALASIMADAPQPHMSATVLLCRRPFTAEEVERLIAAGKGRWLVLFRPDGGPLPPVMKEDAPLSDNYFHYAKEKMDEARIVYESFLATFPDDLTVMKNYPFDVSPLTDDRPFYYFYYRWGDVFRQFLAGSLSTSAGGVFLLLALGLALAGSLVGIFIPLGIWHLRRRLRGEAGGGGGTGWFGLYFAGLGLGYICAELNLVQKYSLFLGHPVYALGVILGGLLVLSGVGSFLSGRLRWRSRTLGAVFAALIAAIVITMLLPRPLFALFAGRAVAVRALAALASIAPLGILMGMPFPLGLRQAGRDRPGLIPWLWGINGFTSVIGSILATIAAIAGGYRTVTLIAVVSYGIAALAALLLGRRSSHS